MTIKLTNGKFAGTYEVSGEKIVFVKLAFSGEVRITVAKNSARYRAVIEAAG